jgi:hypothetical protein
MDHMPTIRKTPGPYLHMCQGGRLIVSYFQSYPLNQNEWSGLPWNQIAHKGPGALDILSSRYLYYQNTVPSSLNLLDPLDKPVHNGPGKMME